MDAENVPSPPGSPGQPGSSGPRAALSPSKLAQKPASPGSQLRSPLAQRPLQPLSPAQAPNAQVWRRHTPQARPTRLWAHCSNLTPVVLYRAGALQSMHNPVMLSSRPRFDRHADDCSWIMLH